MKKLLSMLLAGAMLVSSTAMAFAESAGAAEKGLVRRLVQHGLARVGTLHLVDAEMAGDDKAHFVFASSMSVSAQSGVT